MRFDYFDARDDIVHQTNSSICFCCYLPPGVASYFKQIH
jgi:hypothetical protein